MDPKHVIGTLKAMFRSTGSLVIKSTSGATHHFTNITSYLWNTLRKCFGFLSTRNHIAKFILYSLLRFGKRSCVVAWSEKSMKECTRGLHHVLLTDQGKKW